MAVSPAELKVYLEGTIYPASKNDLRSTARINHAPDVIIDLINNLPERRFNSPGEINKAIDEIE